MIGIFGEGENQHALSIETNCILGVEVRHAHRVQGAAVDIVCDKGGREEQCKGDMCHVRIRFTSERLNGVDKRLCACLSVFVCTWNEKVELGETNAMCVRTW